MGHGFDRLGEQQHGLGAGLGFLTEFSDLAGARINTVHNEIQLLLKPSRLLHLAGGQVVQGQTHLVQGVFHAHRQGLSFEGG